MVSDLRPDPWRAFIESGRTLHLEVDRVHLTSALRRNTRYLVIMGAICVLVVAVVIALMATGIGRFLTYALLGALLVVLLGNVGLGLISRRRILRGLSIQGMFIEVDAAGVRMAGVPALTWPQMLGVIVSDNRATLRQGGKLARGIRRMMYGIGGALYSVTIGLDDMRSVKAAASGPRAAALDLAMHDHGAATLHLDVSLAPEQADQVRAALHAAAALNGVPCLLTGDNAAVARAALQMGRGDRLTPA